MCSATVVPGCITKVFKVLVLFVLFLFICLLYFFVCLFEHCGSLESRYLAARFSIGTWCYYKILQTVSPVMQHEGFRQAGFLPTCT